MMKGLMDHYVSQATMVDCVRAKAEATKAVLGELKAWKVIQENKLDLTKKLLEEAEAQMKALKKVLKDKENEISKSKKQLYRVKEDAIKEYRDSDAFLAKLGDSFANGFDDCLRQVKASFLDLDLSQITIDVEGQILAHPVDSEGTDELFVDDINLDPQGDEEAAHADQEKSIEDGTHQLERDQTVEEKNEKTPAVQQQFFTFSFYLYIINF